MTHAEPCARHVGITTSLGRLRVSKLSDTAGRLPVVRRTLGNTSRPRSLPDPTASRPQCVDHVLTGVEHGGVNLGVFAKIQPCSASAGGRDRAPSAATLCHRVVMLLIAARPFGDGAKSDLKDVCVLRFRGIPRASAVVARIGVAPEFARAYVRFREERASSTFMPRYRT